MLRPVIATLLLPSLALGFFRPPPPPDGLTLGIHKLKRQATTAETSTIEVTFASTTTGSNETGTALATATTTSVAAGNDTSVPTTATTSLPATATQTPTSCTTESTGNATADATNLLVCELSVISQSFLTNEECVPAGGNSSAPCSDLINLNTPCAGVSSDSAAAQCVCTDQFYAAWQSCSACTGVSFTDGNFTAACSGLGYPIDSASNSTTSTTASHNAPPPSAQPHPDPSLLERPAEVASADIAADGGDDEGDKVHLVSEEEAAKLREAISSPDQTESFNAHLAAAKKETNAILSQAEKDERAARAAAASEASKVEKKGEELYEKGSAKAKEIEKEGEQLLGKAEKKGEELYAKAEKKGEELYAKGSKKAKEVEKEVEREARKAGKKAKELGEEAEGWAKEHPKAAGGIIGAFNLALVAGLGIAAYVNWNKPWDRRVVTAVSVGVATVVAGEGALGWYEYEKQE